MLRTGAKNYTKRVLVDLERQLLCLEGALLGLKGVICMVC